MAEDSLDKGDHGAHHDGDVHGDLYASALARVNPMIEQEVTQRWLACTTEFRKPQSLANHAMVRR